MVNIKQQTVKHDLETPLVPENESSTIPQVSAELLQTMLHQRQVRLQNKYAYQKRKYLEDAEYRKKLLDKRVVYNKKRYAEDPAYAEKVKADRRERYARQKQQKQIESSSNPAGDPA